MAARPKEPAFSDGWSLDWRHRGGISPPLSSRWEHKFQSSGSASAQTSMHLHRASFSSTVESSELFAHPPETSEGHLSSFNSPPASCHHSQSSSLAEVSSIGDLTTLPSEPILRSCQSLPSQEESGRFGVPTSFESACQKLSKSSEHGIYSRKASKLCSKQFMSKPSSQLLSRQRSDTSVSYAAGSSKFVPMEMDSMRHRIGSSVEVAPRLTRQNTDSWTMQAFSELVASSRNESSKWSSADLSLDFLAGSSQENAGELGFSYIGQHSATDSQGFLLVSHHAEAPNCGLCTKAIAQRSPLSSQRISGSSDLPAVGILICGHVYHAECLELATPVTHAHDPPCPQCIVLETVQKTQGESILCSMTDMLGFTGQSYVKGKLSRVGVATDDFTGPEFSSRNLQLGGKIPSPPEASSRKAGLHLSALSGDRSFSSKPLLKRQFSLRGKLNRESFVINSSARKPGCPSKVSPENNVGGGSPSDGGESKGQSNAIGYLRS